MKATIYICVDEYNNWSVSKENYCNQPGLDGTRDVWMVNLTIPTDYATAERPQQISWDKKRAE